ncbi:uncharacterized protein PGTG_03050 [Puccinia graminis f. sp. tritici CRL 75-36-700-3]|uniref:HPt domain-containing protein n=1 Tax=Puccinia graminis f. sp. tritici (strain CRL 75-36-700-3 / race SCCL) TaxID=418459 RepID=E3JYG9_PUCGT|nr:uncharacterized protein PGTG_03050 [Puccinia graminis f. sp. tritici CRL 75-36-700-3]EFP77094.2 hypothetical protein PGTG_03050 [Puccinia graminis f. sp. tritici CRL 75-36-700-3]
MRGVGRRPGGTATCQESETLGAWRRGWAKTTSHRALDISYYVPDGLHREALSPRVTSPRPGTCTEDSSATRHSAICPCRLKLHYIAPRQFPLNLTATKTPATLLEAMTSVNHSRQYVMSDSSSSNRPQQLNSARTPGEGYPFPRTPRPQGNLTVSVSKNPTEIPPSPTTPHQSSIRSSSPSSPIIDTEVFKQLLAMEDENSSFSFTHGLIDLYYEDGSRTLDQMRCALQPSDYSTLARLAHFLRGSAASVGIIQVARICELIEMRIISQQQSLNKEWFESQIAAIEQAHVISQQWFRDFYNQQ